jgi:hypothetical protein
MCGSEGGQTPEVRAPGPFVPVVKVAKQKHQPSWGSAEAKVNLRKANSHGSAPPIFRQNALWESISLREFQQALGDDNKGCH